MSNQQPQPTQPSTWTDVCVAKAVPNDGSGRYVRVQKKAYAVFRKDDGAFVVMNDCCPHASASLSSGRNIDNCVMCPMHGWSFSLEDGRCPDNAEIVARVYPTRVDERGYVQAQF